MFFWLLKLTDMKKSISLFMAIIMLSLTPFQLVAKQAETSCKLISGTPVEVRTVVPVTSAQIGNIVGEVTSDVYDTDGETILIRKGARVEITASFEKNGAPGKAGIININGASVSAVDGKTIMLSTDPYSVKGKGKGGLAWGLGIGIGVFTLLGFLFLFLKGGNAEIPAGTNVPGVCVNGTYTVVSEP